MNRKHFMQLFLRSKVMIAAVVLALAIGAFVGSTLFKQTIVVREGTADTPAAMSSVDIMIDYGNGTVRTWNTVSWHEAMSVMSLIETIAGAKEIALITKDAGAKGVVVESIDTIRNDSTTHMRWQYWVNNAYEPRIASKYYLKPGDIVMWKFVQEQVK